jgi:predicted phage baseplate assembly protein
VARHLVPERADVTDQLAGWLPLPGQVLRVPGAAGLLADGPGEAELDLTERDGTGQTWTAVTTWVGVGPADRVFVVDRQRGELRFGDGLVGRVPRPAAEAPAELRFGIGAGAIGNLGSRGVWAQEGGAVVGVNPVPATGGTDPEPVLAARQRAADELARPERVVTAADATAIALATPGVAVARAQVSPGHHPSHPCVDVPTALSVTLVPEVDRTVPPEDWTAAPMPDPGLLAAVLARLGAARLLGQEVFVGPPSYRAVRVRLTVSRSGRDDEVRARIIEALRRHLDPLEGGADGDGWPFGGVVRPSELVGVAGRAAGVEAAVTNLAVALDDGAWSDCDERPTGPRDLVWLAGAELTWTAAATGGSGLQ